MIELFPLFWEEFEDNKKVLSKLTYLRGGGGESSKMVCGLMSFMDVPQACWSFFEQIGYKFSQQ